LRGRLNKSAEHLRPDAVEVEGVKPTGVKANWTKWSWKGDNDRKRHWLICYYFPNKFEEEENGVMQTRGDGSFIALFITDVEPTKDNISYLYDFYRD
jgi:hypothetical protein